MNANRMIKMLCEREIVSTSQDEVECKRKMVELGLTIPDGDTDCLLYGKEPRKAMYVFVCFRGPARRSTGQRFFGLRFDFAKYLGDPLATPNCDVHEASILLVDAVAELTGFDLHDCTWHAQGGSLN